MITILTQGLTIFMTACLIIFVFRTIQIGILADRSDIRSKSLLSAIAIVLGMPWSKKNHTPLSGKLSYYFDLLSGKMIGKYREHLKNVAMFIKAECSNNPQDPVVRETVISNFSHLNVIVENAVMSNSLDEFVVNVEQSASFIAHLINKDIEELIDSAIKDGFDKSNPSLYMLLVSIEHTANLHNLDTNTIVIVSLDYLQRVDLTKEYNAIA